MRAKFTFLNLRAHLAHEELVNFIKFKSGTVEVAILPLVFCGGRVVFGFVFATHRKTIYKEIFELVDTSHRILVQEAETCYPSI